MNRVHINCMNTKYTYGELGVFFFGDNKWTIKQISKRRLRKKNKRLGKFFEKEEESIFRNIDKKYYRESSSGVRFR